MWGIRGSASAWSSVRLRRNTHNWTAGTSSGRQWNETLLLCPFWSRNGFHIIPPRFETSALKGNERLWHCSAMKWVIFGLLIFSPFARADERTDRLAIERIVDALNDYKSGAGQQQVSTLFTADAETQLSLLSELNQKLIPRGTPWSEVTKARIALHSIRFITPDVALVDAANTQYGSTILVRRVPVLLIMKRETIGWRIASIRVMVDLGCLRYLSRRSLFRYRQVFTSASGGWPRADGIISK